MVCVRGAGPHLMAFLYAEDAALRGLAAWALGVLGEESACPQLESLLRDSSELELYVDRALKVLRVMDLVKEALTRIRH